MASIASTCRCSARAAVRQAKSHGAARGFTTTNKALAASNFKMPALSPTMTEGNISSWKLKEGDSFSAGDVILEVETDKATMDVEAQDDGILAKILQGDGSKAVQVGSRIAVLAEPGDDLASLEIPEDESSAPAKTGKTDAPTPTQAEPPPSQQEKPGEKPAKATSERGGDKSVDTSKGKETTQTKKSAKGQPQNKKYPLYPSVAVLIHQHNLKVEDLVATGPGGRLLKGDVLAALGQAPSSYPEDLASKLSKRSHLDLSDIKRAPAKVEKKETPKAAEKAVNAGPPPPISVTAPISMANVLKVQKRLQDTLGVSLPLSTFVARAVEMANEDLPISRPATPTADELFDAVVGVHKVGKKSSRGHFMPQIIALPTTSAPSSRPAVRSQPRKSDVLDELLGSKRPSPANVGLGRRTGTANAISGANNIFSVSVDEVERKRAQVFLNRVKTVLETQPGTLIL